MPGLLHFTGFRRVLEGDLDMEDLGGRRQVVIGTPPSIFKVDAAEALIGAAGVFENFASADWVLRVRQINSLVDRYAGGVIEKLATNLHGSIRLRVRARDSAASHDFDGLSSGQKEIISTLYLIWRHTLDNPSLVLIDEPELHLNAEWRVDYVRMLHRIAPHNQYILATHSEDIFASVDPSRRIILNPVAVPV
ncbi:MAG: AAA family ATPase [Bryobacteraceae bacterium]